jgi:hypothetical protein
MGDIADGKSKVRADGYADHRRGKPITNRSNLKIITKISKIVLFFRKDKIFNRFS